MNAESRWSVILSFNFIVRIRIVRSRGGIFRQAPNQSQ